MPLEVLQMPRSRDQADDLAAALDAIRARLPECDKLVIVAQKKTGGLLWDGPASQQLDTTVFLLAALQAHLLGGGAAR